MEAYLVTDRKLASEEFLLRLVHEAIAAGIERVQVREKDLPGRPLLALVRRILAAAEGSRTTVFVNDRVDVALAAAAQGAHLGRAGLPVETARRMSGEDFVIGASAHSLEEAIEAQERGADYLFVGPVFPTPSKAAFGEPLGLPRLESILRRIQIPVYAIGGITPERLPPLRGLPLTGVAMISAFVRARSVKELVQRVRGEGWS